MNNKELEKEWQMSYRELLTYLKNKYGNVPYNYFLTESCKSKCQKNTRTIDGLFIHHDYEYDEIDTRVCDLSKPEMAVLWPWKYQLAENLTYCNWLEHLIIHIKINKLRAEQCGGYVSDGVENFLVPELNDLYFMRLEAYQIPEWKFNCFSAVEDDLDDYCYMVTEWLCSLGYSNTNWKNW